MVCPMAKKQVRQDSPTDYPFEALYRPWSWVLSSFSNILLFAVLFGIIIYKYRKRSGKGRRNVTYRSVETKKTQVLESSSKTPALITGGNGALGREIVRCLIEDGSYRVYSLDLTIPDSEDRNPDVYSYVQADIIDTDSLKLAMRGVEVVFHTAGLTPLFVGHTKEHFYRVNATGTECVVSACRACGVKRLVHTSSLNVVLSSDPDQSVVLLDETAPYPKKTRDNYGGSKMVGEKCVLAANGKDGLLTCALRPHRLMTKEWLKSCKLAYTVEGSFKQQFIPVDTAARVHMLVDKKLKLEGEPSLVAGKVYFLSFEDWHTHSELAKLIARERDGSETVVHVPMWLITILAYINTIMWRVFGMAPVDPALRVDMLPFFVKDHTVTSARGRKEIGWEDKRSWKEVICEMVRENGTNELKKEQ